MTLEELATQVAQRRQAVVELKSEWDALQAAFAEKHAGTVESLAATKAALADEENELRAAARAEYERTGTKKLPRGIGVREVSVLDYDEIDALAWAKDHGLALKLDAKAFEKIAKVDTPAFVTVLTTTTITLPTDTSKLLGDS